MTTNSHRDNVVDAIAAVMGEEVGYEGDEINKILADAVFDALGITKDEQDSTGGYFIHHAGTRAVSKEYILIPLTEEIKNALSWEEAGHHIWKFIAEARKQ